MAAGEVIGSFIEQELKSTRERRASIESRGVTVITTSGVIVTLQMAFFTALVPKDRVASTGVRTFVALSLVSFLAAAAVGILVNLPARKQEMAVDLNTLRPHLTDPHWSADSDQARRAIAAAQLHVGAIAFGVTNRKGKTLIFAFLAELLGMAMLSVAVLIAITT
ncbi:hypothetical protein ABT255_03735 [Streptomyces mirabilis]|uniref:hypothetical protein n=1 Tax=Streptomyces mirabilis TaxID=68239 RepID=UPI00332E79E4